jgi:hypothetical protein
MYIYNFVLRMTDTRTSKNIDLSSWDSCIQEILLYIMYTYVCFCVTYLICVLRKGKVKLSLTGRGGP